MKRTLLAAVVLATACGDDGPPSPPPADWGPVVAEVNGVPIHRVEVESRMRAENLPAREALDRLIDEELTVEAAQKLGLRPDRDVKFTRRRAEVQLLLEREIEARVRPEDVSEADVASAYESGRTLEADHLLVKAKRGASKAQKAAAQALAQRVHDAAVRTTTREQFVELARTLAEPGQDLVHEDLGSFQRNGRYVRAFEDRAFALQRAGQVSEPFETEFGWHVVRLRSVGNFFGPSLQEGHDKVVEGLVSRRRRAALEDFLRGLAERGHVEVSEPGLTLLGDGS